MKRCYKVGERVRIKNRDRLETAYRKGEYPWLNKTLIDYAGMIVMVTGTHGSGYVTLSTPTLGDWWWSIHWITPTQRTE